MDGRPANSNGRFELFYRGGWAYLTVFPPTGSGRPVYPEDIENRMKILGVPRSYTVSIRQLIDDASGEPFALVEWPNGQALASTIAVHIAKDGMTATATISPPRKGAAAPTLADVIGALAEAGVTYGIDRNYVQRMVEQAAYGKPLLVATGTAPIPGLPTRVVHHFNVNRGKPYLEMDFGRINLRELNFIQNKRAGDMLAELAAPVAAVDGRKVTGEPIPAESAPQQAPLLAGPNTVLSPDGTKLFAACEGNVRIAQGAILIEPVISVKNVDFSTGNVHFDGSVVIEGSVADGFVVEAGGDIQIGSSVGRATLKAGGSIVLKTGINGNGKGVIECGGDLFAKYLESCTVSCRAHVLVEEAIMHSHVVAYNHCVLGGRRSEVIASELIVGGSFWCKKLGNFNEQATRVTVGVPPEIVIECRNTAAAIETSQEALDKAVLQLEQLGKMQREGRADERVVLAIAQLEATVERLRPELAELRGRYPALRDRVAASRSSIVVVEETMYKGVTVTFGQIEYRGASNGIRKVVLKARDGQITESAFNYKDRPVLAFVAPGIDAEKPADPAA